MSNVKEFSVEEKLTSLVTLQKIESKLDEYKILKGELPMEVSDLEDEIQGLHSRQTRVEEEINGIQEFINSKKETIKEADALIKKYDKQSQNVKNSREFEAINKEIEMQQLEVKLAEKHIKDANEEIAEKVLLLEKAKKENKRSIVFLTEKTAIVETNAAASIGEAQQQRARWLSKSGAYGGGAAGIYGLIVLLANALVPLSLVFSLCSNDGFLLVGTALFGKAAVDLLLLSLAVLFFREPLLLLLVVPGELIYPLLAVAASVQAFSGNIFWKDRSWKK